MSSISSSTSTSTSSSMPPSNPTSPRPSLAIRFEELVALQSLGINSSNIGFNNLTLESDKYICIREHSSSENSSSNTTNLKDEVVIVDLSSPSSPIRRPITADSSIMHPDYRIMAIRSGHQLQVFDLDLKKKIASHSMMEEVCFWKWISSSTITIITQRACYHWDVLDTTTNTPSSPPPPPFHLFDRHPSLSDCQIINYKHYGKDWMLLVGIRAKEGRFAGSMQLYNTERRASQIVEGHTGDFAEIPADPLSLDGVCSNGGDTTTTTSNSHSLFIFANRAVNSSFCKVQISEINYKEGRPKFGKRSFEIPFPPEASSDFPIGLQVTPGLGIMYLVTKFGFLYIYDLYTCSFLYGNRISAETIFLSAPLRNPKFSSNGIIGVNRKGQVLSVSLDLEDPSSTFPSQEITCRLKILLFKAGIIVSSSMYSSVFKEYMDTLIEEGNLSTTISLFINAPPIASFRENFSLKERISMMPSNDSSPLLQLYVQIIRCSDSRPLDGEESMEFIRLFLSSSTIPPYLEDLKRAIENDSCARLSISLPFIDVLIECSLKFGDPLFYTLSLTLLLPMASGSTGSGAGNNDNVHQRVCKSFAGLGEWGKLGVYLNKVAHNFLPDYFEILGSLILSNNIEQAIQGSKAILKGNPLSALSIFNIFMSHSLPKQGTTAVLDCCREDVLLEVGSSTLCKTETMAELQELQTEILSVLLEMAPPLAIALLKPPVSQSNKPIFTSYDHVHLSQIIENAFNLSSPPDPILLCLAMEHSKTPNDLIRLLSKSSDILLISEMDLVEIITILQWDPEIIIILFNLLFKLNPSLYVNHILEVTRNIASFRSQDVLQVISLFQENHQTETLFILTKKYLGSPLFSSSLEEDRSSLNTIHIKTCIALKKWDDLEDSLRRLNPFKDDEIFSLLLENEKELPSMIPLIVIADLYENYLPSVIGLLLEKDLFSWVTKYVERMNPSRLQIVIEICLNNLNGVGSNHLSLKDIEGLLLANYRNISNMNSFYSFLIERNLTSLLIPLLKKSKSSPEILLKCLIQEGVNEDIKEFLVNEKYSFSQTGHDIMKDYSNSTYIEWAFIAFKRASSFKDIIGIFSLIREEDYKFYYDILIYNLLKERMVPRWTDTIVSIPFEGEFLSSLLDGIRISSITSEDVSPLLKSLMANGKNEYLLIVLEEMIYQEKFANNASLENLFLKNMISCHKSFLSHLTRLKSFNTESILTEIFNQKILFAEEAHQLYSSSPTASSKSKALLVLIADEWGIRDLDRAIRFAKDTNLPSTWRCLAFNLVKSTKISNFPTILEAAKKGSQSPPNGKGIVDDPNLNQFTSEILIEILKKSPPSSKEEVLSFLLSFKEKQNTIPHSPRFPSSLDSEIILHSILLNKTDDVHEMIKELSLKSPSSLTFILHRLIEEAEFSSLKEILIFLKDYKRLTLVTLLEGDYDASFDAWNKVSSKEKNSTFYLILMEKFLDSNNISYAKNIFIEFISISEREALSSIKMVWEQRGLVLECKEILMEISSSSSSSSIKDRLALLLIEYYPDEALNFITTQNNLSPLRDLALKLGRIEMAQEISFIMKDYSGVIDLLIDKECPFWNQKILLSSLERLTKPLSLSICQRLVKCCFTFDPTFLESLVPLLLKKYVKDDAEILEFLREEKVLFLLKDSLSLLEVKSPSINVALAEIALQEGRFIDDVKNIIHQLTKSFATTTTTTTILLPLAKALKDHNSINIRRLNIPLIPLIDPTPKGLLEALKMALQLESFDLALDIFLKSDSSPLLTDELLRYFSGIPSKLLSIDYKEEDEDVEENEGGRPMLFLLVCYISIKKGSLRSSIVRECNWIRKWDDICEPVMCVL